MILVGETASTGFPRLHQSRGIGGTYASQALADGIITPKEDVGAFRAQMVDSLSGKIIRIDPAPRAR